ncbi:MAG: helix-turn-helix domain-containing protein [Planctomycetes bacterium]|nr:helix-turn-helix domain-containing protein [Planctomycetota bacterium]
MSFWGRYVPVAERRAKAKKKMEKLRKKGKDIQPVEIEGRTIARSFWGKGWCDHLESFSDYANRLPRGRTYVRNGSVCHLEIQPGRIEAMVTGSSLYKVSIGIKKLKPAAWKAIKKECSGQIGSMLELLQGKLSDQVMAVVTDRKDGLFPKPGEIELSCSCPDWAVMCKHVASALYGVGSRLDTRPELLFLLRDVDAQELIAAEMALPGAAAGVAGDALADDQVGAIFGIDFDADAQPGPATKPKGRPRSGGASKATPKKKAQTASVSRAVAETSTGTRPRIRPTGRSVARLRRQLGLSVAQFAETLGVTPASVYRWESTQGRLKLQVRPLNALAALHQQAKAK